MPPLIAAATPILGTVIFGSLTVGGLLTTVALTGASFLLNSALAPKASGGSFSDQGVKILTRDPVPPGRLIMGRALVGGALFFLEVKPPYLYYGVVIASHEIDAVEEIRLGGKNVNLNAGGFPTVAPYVDATQSYAQFSIRLGTDDQLIDPILAADFPELPASFRQRGHATVVCKFDYGGTAANHEIVWGNAQPSPLFLVRGAKVYDPRKPSHLTSAPATWEWSDNASLVQAWWLTHKNGGKRDWSQIDVDSLKTAAANDDLMVALKAGGSERRWTANGVALLTEEPFDVITNLMTANLGMLVWRDGKYSFVSGGPRFPTWTLNDDAARGDLQMRYDRPRRELVNTVDTVFTAPDREYQLANGPSISDAAYLAADGEEHRITARLPFTASHTRAQRIAKVLLESARRGRLLSAPYSIDALRLSASDIIKQWDNDVWRWTPATDERDFTLEPADL
jgi:Putative phage tail protein